MKSARILDGVRLTDLDGFKTLGIQASMQAIESLQEARDEPIHHKELALSRHATR
jgi:hypothetical protein